MSANLEKSDSKTRVTRARARLNSAESINADSDRPETPTGRLRMAKKLEPIDETTVTPTRRTTRAGSIQRNLIAEESTTPASPLRRVTRRMSNDLSVLEVSVSSPARLSRARSKQNVAESDDEVMFVDESIATPRTKSKIKNLNASVVKLEEVVEEEPSQIDIKDKTNDTTDLNKSKDMTDLNKSKDAVDLNKSKDSVDLNKSKDAVDLNKSKDAGDLNKSKDAVDLNKSKDDGDLNKSTDSTRDLHELELRNRSISKSPCVIFRNSTGSNDTSSVQDISKGSIQSENTTGGAELNVEERQKSLSPSKSPKKKSRISTALLDVISAQDDSKGSVQSVIDVAEPDVEERQKSLSPSKTPKKKLSETKIQTSSQSPARLNVGTNSARKTTRIAFKNISSPENTQPENANESDTVKDQINVILKELESDQPEDAAVEEVQKSPKRVSNVFKNAVIDDNETSINSRDSGFSAKEMEQADKNDAAQDENSEEIVSKLMADFVPDTMADNVAEKPSQLKKVPSFINKTQVIPTDMIIDSDNEQESVHDETNKQITDMDITNFVENKTSEIVKRDSKTIVAVNTWNQSIRGVSKQIDTLKQPEKEVIHETPNKSSRKIISSDESESENERNSLIDDEASVADEDEDSMTKSERDYLEENEIVEDGESLGSQDSNEMDSEDEGSAEELDSDSFIDNDEISDTYSMDSHDKLLEEHEEELNKSQTKKKRSRIIPQFSSSEDEVVKSPAKATQPNQLSAKKSRESLTDLQNKENADQNMDVSPEKTQKADKSVRQSLPVIHQLPKTDQSANKKSRKSMPNVEVSTDDANESSTSAQEVPLKTFKSDKKNRKSLPNIQDNVEFGKLNKKSRKSYPNTEEFEASPVKLQKAESENDQEMFSSNLSSQQNSDDITNISKKRKREDEEVEEPSAGSKRFRNMSANESEALHMDDYSNMVENEKMEVDSPEKSKKKKKKVKVVEPEDSDDSSDAVLEEPVAQKPKKKKAKATDYNSILDRCNEYMEKTKLEKKAKMALKKEQKAKKQEKKLLKKQDENPAAQENLDSSTGENKENSEKKKKKKNKKKQKLLDEIDEDKKEDMSVKLDKLQQKLELKRQRKKEKKLAKLAQQTAETEETAIEKKNNEKSNKASTHEEVPQKLTTKKDNKHAFKGVPLDAVELEKLKKKSKKDKKAEKVVEEVPLQEVKQKKSKQTADPDIAPRQKVLKISAQEETAAAQQNKKVKKRPITETLDDDVEEDVVEKPKAKKRLNILKQVENPLQVLGQKKSSNKITEEPKPSSSLTSSKLNRLIPKDLGATEKQVPKKKKKKVAVEEKKELKRPVWTSAGVFIEESVEPYTFKTTKYQPIACGSSSSTNYGVMAFTAKKKSSAPTVDYKMQQMMKRNKNRDKSIKNLKNLM